MRSWLASVPASWSTIPANADLMLDERNIDNDNNIDGEEVFNQDCEQDDCENIEKDPDPIGQNHEITGLDHAIFGLIGNANALNAAGDICDPLFEESNDEYVHATASSDAEPARKKRRSAAVDYLENVRSGSGTFLMASFETFHLIFLSHILGLSVRTVTPAACLLDFFNCLSKVHSRRGTDVCQQHKRGRTA